MTFKEKLFMRYFFSETKSITLNPFEKECIHVHVIPPRKDCDISSLAIINGRDIVALNPMWAIIFAIFIDQINYFGHEINENNLFDAVHRTISYSRLIYMKTDKDVLEEDLKEIIDTIIGVSEGRVIVAPISVGNYSRYMKHPHRMDLMVTAMRVHGIWNCNQKCLNCYASGQSEAEVSEQLSTSDWKEIINELKKIGIPQITFTGGEPLLRPDIVDNAVKYQWCKFKS